MNQASNEHKEAIKVGYNLNRKVVLIGIWAALPVVLYFFPTFFGCCEPAADKNAFIEQVGLL